MNLRRGSTHTSLHIQGYGLKRYAVVHEVDFHVIFTLPKQTRAAIPFEAMRQSL